MHQAIVPATMSQHAAPYSFEYLSPDDVSAISAHLGLPTPTPDVPLCRIAESAGLTPEAIYSGLSATTSIRLMIAAAAMRGVRRLPRDPRLDPAPHAPCGPERRPLASGEKIPRARAPTVPTPTPTAERPTQRSSTLPPQDHVLATIAPNPKRAGSASWDRYALYRLGATTAELLASGLSNADLRWDLGHGFLAFEPPASEVAQ